MKPFVYDICQFIDDNIAHFNFGTGDTNLKVGELEAASEGVFAQQVPSSAPDMETDVEYFVIEFWARNNNSENAFNDLRRLQNFLHQNHHFQTDNYLVHFAHALGTIEDMDRDTTNAKILRISFNFIVQPLLS